MHVTISAGDNFAIFICINGVRKIRIGLEARFKSCNTLDIMLRALLHELPLLYPQYEAANIHFRHFLGVEVRVGLRVST